MKTWRWRAARFGLFGATATRLEYPSMVALLDGHPEITCMNQHVQQKELTEG